ncbi:MAG: LysM domain-containing protein [Chromatiales bacterium]|nr:LysM domain-containing protein [Chromatiales bacterium]MDX9767894.1 LysM domain-containing protein [Ectothiorhodospiraceae bacterium]
MPADQNPYARSPYPLPPPAEAPKPAPIPMREDAPIEYVVQKGDTLWDIAARYLRDPWFWPEIWIQNQQIRDPHRIYPGDVLMLHYVDGKPQVVVEGGPRVDGRAELPTLKLGPGIRATPVEQEPVMIPVQAIRPFLIRPRIITWRMTHESPYIVAGDKSRLVFGNDDRVYVRGLPEKPPQRYSVLRPGKRLKDPDTGDWLGYEAIPVGDAILIREGDPATFDLTRIEREAVPGDRLYPYDDEDDDRAFFPRPPPGDPQGTVMSLVDALSSVGQHQVAVINLGTDHGMEKGHVLSVHQPGRIVYDKFVPGGEAGVQLPEEHVGLVMVFRTFDRVSYALVMESYRPLREGFKLRKP